LRKDGDDGRRSREPEQFVGGWVAFEEGRWRNEETKKDGLDRGGGMERGGEEEE